MKKKPTKEKTHLLNAPSGDKNRVQNTCNESLLFDKHLLQKSESSHSNNITNKLSKI